jgi:tricarballylate dehydrogenase
MGSRGVDVVIVGGGNAALCAALAAEENGAKVSVVERAPEDERGGNTRFTAGSIRFAYAGVDDLQSLMPDLSESEIAMTDFGTYTEDQYFDDMFRVTQYRCDPDLVECLVRQSKDTMLWMRDKGVRFIPIYGRQAFKIDGKFKFWGGLTVESVGGGPGLVESLTRACVTRGIEIQYDTRAVDLSFDGKRVTGVVVRRSGERPETLPRADSRPTLSGARAISGPVGRSRRCAGRASIRATGSGWRWQSVPPHTGIGPAVTRSAGSATRPSSAIWPSVTSSRNTPTRSASW